MKKYLFTFLFGVILAYILIGITEYHNRPGGYCDKQIKNDINAQVFCKTLKN